MWSFKFILTELGMILTKKTGDILSYIYFYSILKDREYGKNSGYDFA